MIKVAPSILSADFSRLGEEVRRVEASGADWVHVDVMDGMFVPNITIGPSVIKNLRPHSKLPFDVHLMIVKPERYIKDFASAGADYITVHVEASEVVSQNIDKIHALGKKAGVSVNPATPLEMAEPYLQNIELLLIMTVNPGFGGQSFMSEVVPKIEQARRYRDEHGLDFDIEIDGGINAATGRTCVKAGATALAAGSALFGAKDMKAEMESWRRFPA
ncbi:MAG: ribulose-phosphate 3-epimerase [Methanomassiliicoccales archaeon PtaU1.Bin124]|nr:MAG: ribulose-phosphate 3-epimerase [Methanomassiliicoccales archaeon PtaU1.Bin124]